MKEKEMIVKVMKEKNIMKDKRKVRRRRFNGNGRKRRNWIS